MLSGWAGKSGRVLHGLVTKHRLTAARTRLFLCLPACLQVQDVSIRVIELMDHVLSMYDRAIGQYTAGTVVQHVSSTVKGGCGPYWAYGTLQARPQVYPSVPPICPTHPPCSERFKRNGIELVLNSRVKAVAPEAVTVVDKDNSVSAWGCGCWVVGCRLCIAACYGALRCCVVDKDNSVSGGLLRCPSCCVLCMLCTALLPVGGQGHSMTAAHLVRCLPHARLAMANEQNSTPQPAPPIPCRPHLMPPSPRAPVAGV